MIGLGFVVALGILVMLANLPWRWKLWVVSHITVMDIAIFVLLFTLHGGGGTFSGPMVATIGALFCHVALQLAKRVIGYLGPEGYVRGFIDASEKL